MDCSISTIVELPEVLHEALQKWLDRHPRQSQSDAIAAAINLLLTREETQCK